MILNILGLLMITGVFVLLFIVAPWLVLGFKVKAEDLIENCFKCLLISFTIVVNVVYILGLLKILYAFTLIPILIIIWIYFFLRVKKWRILNYYIGLVIFSERFVNKIYRPKVLFFGTVTYIKKRIKNRKSFLMTHLNALLLLIALGFGTYTRFYHNIIHLSYSLPDVYIHTEWTKFLETNRIFSNGVYPFGLHGIVITLHKMFAIDIVTIMRFLGCTIGFFFLLGMYFFAKKLFRSPFAANVVMLIYCCSSFIPFLSYSRQGSTLPQEAGMMFMLPTAYFFIDYIKNKNKHSLWYFAMGISMTISCHFYITIVLVFLCGFIALFNFFHIIKAKQFVPLLLSVVIAIGVSFAPMIAGRYLKNIAWEGSMYWAIGVLTNAEGAQDEENLDESQSPDINNEVTDGITEQTDGEAGQKKKELTFEEKIQPAILKQEIKNTAYDIFTYINAFYADVILICVLFLFSAVMLLSGKKHRMYGKIMLGMCAFFALFMFMIMWPYLGFPVIFASSRLQIFTTINTCFLIGVPVEILFSLTMGENKMSKRSIIATALCSVLFFGYIIQYDKIQTPSYALQAQYDGAIKAYYKIRNNFPKYNWTIVSPVDETCMVRNEGFHHELKQFIFEDIIDYEKKPQSFIPTEYVFFYFEKKPIEAFRIMSYYKPEDMPKDQPPTDLEDAKKTLQDIYKLQLKLDSEYYTNIEARRVVEGKLKKWIDEYIKAYPKEMCLYYEDDSIMVYKLHQNMYNQNNLVINYGYNH